MFYKGGLKHHYWQLSPACDLIWQVYGQELITTVQTPFTASDELISARWQHSYSRYIGLIPV